MNTKELYLETVFSCMACDGEIAPEEVNLVKQLVSESETFSGLDIEHEINGYVASINSNGKSFLSQYLRQIPAAGLSDDEQMNIVDLAIKTIMADSVITYSEIKFFKKIRARLTLTDDAILERHPDKEDFLLPDNNTFEEPEWTDAIFNEITLN